MTLSITSAGRTWEEAAAPGAVRLARRFENAWRAADGPRPRPEDFLPDALDDCPGARLALLRADLTLRWEAGDTVSAEWYRDRYLDLDDETLVALIYEEFCLREEAQGTPDPAEYYARFPSVAARLSRVLDIHGLVGSGATSLDLATTADDTEPPATPFPEAGQTIAGFHLVEELGRGAFARVFLARERQLADRPVALKVARAGSREPQTLARLQHTHIVPVHSYRTDPATGLHLLCMPFFGRVTLARILPDPQVRVARFGSDLVEALDRLGPDEEAPSGRSAGRIALGPRTYPQAIAWWCARMAEALEHAHDRGVLHRDVKPSNVLVTSDGMPMLLDFNLARESVRDGDDSALALGGTLDYMAPEHLEELADGVPGRVDARSDIYGLGVLLFEALAGARPFPPPRGALSATEILLLAAEDRRAGAPWLTDNHPEVPDALEAVVRRCLQPDPARRYACAADLAADLQAVADDLPLRFAREPFPSRAQRWFRRHRRTLALSAPAVAALGCLAAFLVQAQLERGRLRAEIVHLIAIGEVADRAGDFSLALAQFETARQLTDGRDDLGDLFQQSRERANLTRQKTAGRDASAALLREGEALRFRLAGIADDPAVEPALRERLRPFYVLENPGWTGMDALLLLDPRTRGRMLDEVNELLFLWALARDRAGDAATVRTLRDRALLFTPTRGPWLALTTVTHTPTVMPDESSASSCFLWGLLQDHQGRSASALDWLRRAVRMDEGNAWRHAILALAEQRSGNRESAQAQADVAVALQPQSPWTRVVRARVTRDRDQAARDYQSALRAAVDDPALVIQIRQAIANLPVARNE